MIGFLKFNEELRQEAIEEIMAGTYLIEPLNALEDSEEEKDEDERNVYTEE